MPSKLFALTNHFGSDLWWGVLAEMYTEARHSRVKKAIKWLEDGFHILSEVKTVQLS